MQLISLVQRFSTRIPWHTGVPWIVIRSAMGIWVRGIYYWGTATHPQQHVVPCQLSKKLIVCLENFSTLSVSPEMKTVEKHCFGEATGSKWETTKNNLCQIRWKVHLLQHQFPTVSSQMFQRSSQAKEGRDMSGVVWLQHLAIKAKLLRHR